MVKNLPANAGDVRDAGFQPNEVAMGTTGDRKLGERSGERETLSKMPMREPRQKTISTVRQKATLF